jgi:hypothetical protein
VLRYLLAAAVGYALGRRNRRAVATVDPVVDPLDGYDDVLDDDERAFVDTWTDAVDRAHHAPNRSHGYVPALPTEAAR